jgi:hypothetical protein
MTGESGGRIWRERGGEKKFVEGGGREWRENECQTIIGRCCDHANGRGLTGRSAAAARDQTGQSTGLGPD